MSIYKVHIIQNLAFKEPLKGFSSSCGILLINVFSKVSSSSWVSGRQEPVVESSVVSCSRLEDIVPTKYFQDIFLETSKVEYLGCLLLPS